MCVHVKCFKILKKNFFKWVKFRAKSTHFGIFFSWKCVMKVHRHFLYHRKHNALFKKCFQLVDGMMTVNTNEHDLPSLRTGIRRVNQRYSSIDIHRSNWFHKEGPLSLIFPSQTYDVTHLWVNVKIERRDKLYWKSSTMINLKKIC